MDKTEIVLTEMNCALDQKKTTVVFQRTSAKIPEDVEKRIKALKCGYEIFEARKIFAITAEASLKELSAFTKAVDAKDLKFVRYY